MKLATLKPGGRDGTLVVVSRDLTRALPARPIAATLQAALDDWATVAPLLEALAERLEAGEGRDTLPFDQTACAAPLPRAYQWLDGSAYLNHVELVRRARGAELPDRLRHDPLMYQGGSDTFVGPRDPIRAASEDWGIDFEGEVAVICDDVPRGVTPAAARRHIKLIGLVNDVSLRNLIPDELSKGFGFLHGKPPTAFAPLAVTPDELGAAWDGGRLHLPLLSFLNGAPFGRPDAGVGMAFDFAQLIAHAAHTRPLGAGSVIGSGTVSNKQPDATASRVENGGLGYSCIAEPRLMEAIEFGAPRTPFLSFGDRVQIEMRDDTGMTIFGSIDQVVQKDPEPLPA